MARQGKTIVLRDLHAGMPESERRSHAEILERVFSGPADVIVLHGDLVDGAANVPVPQADPAVAAVVRNVRDRLGYFLEMIDRCDILYFDKVGERLVFIVCARVDEHLSLIRNAIAGERCLLSELGIEPRDVDIVDDVIRINVPAPADAATLS